MILAPQPQQGGVVYVQQQAAPPAAVWVQQAAAQQQALATQPGLVLRPTLLQAQAPQQHMFVKQAAPNAVRLVQVAANTMQPQPMLAPQPQQGVAEGSIVLVNVNGSVQRGLVQNGSVVLLGDAAAPRPLAPAPSQQVLVRQVVGAPPHRILAQPGAPAAPMLVPVSSAQVQARPIMVVPRAPQGLPAGQAFLQATSAPMAQGLNAGLLPAASLQARPQLPLMPQAAMSSGFVSMPAAPTALHAPMNGTAALVAPPGAMLPASGLALAGAAELSGPAPPGTPGLPQLSSHGHEAASLANLLALGTTTPEQRASTAACGSPSAPGMLSSQGPGTPLRANSGGGSAVPQPPVSSEPPGGAGAGAASSKEAVMRLVARSFLETGIALDAALTMVQPSDREQLAAAFAAEAAAAPPTAPTAPAAAPITLTGLGGGDQQVDLGPKPGSGLAGGGSSLLGGDSLRLAGLSYGSQGGSDAPGGGAGLSSWGFSLFAGTHSSGGLADLAGGPDTLAGAPAGVAASFKGAGVNGARRDACATGMLGSLSLA